MFKALQEKYFTQKEIIVPEVQLISKDIKQDFISNKKANQEFLRSAKAINEFLKGGITKFNTNSISKEALFVKLSIIINPDSDYLSEDTEEQWAIVNSLLSKKISLDYNIDIPEEFNSMDQLLELYSRIRLAVNDLSPYLELQCKDCNSTFVLNYGEIVFYVENNLYVPKRCDQCRKAKSY